MAIQKNYVKKILSSFKVQKKLKLKKKILYSICRAKVIHENRDFKVHFYPSASWCKKGHIPVHKERMKREEKPM